MRLFSIGTGWPVWVMICLALTACALGPSPPVQYYMLNPETPAADANRAPEHPAMVRVTVEPVQIPRYLNRPQIVTHQAGTAYHLDEFNQWLEPLDNNLTRVITENLAAMLGADGIDVLAAPRSPQSDFNLAVQILRLDGRRGTETVLVARWSLFRPSEREPVRTRRFAIRESVADDSYRSFVAAQNHMVAELCRAVAAAIGPITKRDSDG